MVDDAPRHTKLEVGEGIDDGGEGKQKLPRAGYLFPNAIARGVGRLIVIRVRGSWRKMGNRSESQRVEWLIIRDILILREGQEFKNRDYNYFKVIQKRTKK